MCGLVGFSGKEDANLESIKLMMLHNSMSRGTHATGFYSKATGLVKSADAAEDFLSSNYRLLTQDSVVLGHVRHATVGDKTDDSLAHPFQEKNIVFQHNGTLKNYKALAKKHDIPEDSYKVDSEALGKIIDKHWNTENAFKVLEEYEGAAATMTLDTDTGELFVSRDEERTLFFGYKDGGIYISSIENSLKMIGCGTISAFTPYHLYTIKEGAITNVTRFHKKEVVEPVLADKRFIKELITADGKSHTIALSSPVKGFTRADTKPAFLKGLHLECSYSPYSIDSGVLTKGKIYRAVSDNTLITANSSIERIKVVDDNGNLSTFNVTAFKLEDCLFYRTRPVKVINPDSLTTNVEIGTVATVVNYLIGNTYLFIKLPGGAIEKIDIINVRVLTSEETEKFTKGELTDVNSPEDINFYNISKQYSVEGDYTPLEEKEEVKNYSNNEESDEDVDIEDLYLESIAKTLETVSQLANSALKETKADTKEVIINKLIDFTDSVRGKKILNV